MGCSCSIDIDHDSSASCFWEVTRKARKEHICCECGVVISPGDKYEYVSGVWDGGFDTYKTCSDCVSVRDNLFCSWVYTTLWEDLRENLLADDHVSSKCMMSLTPRAREMVCDLIEEIWAEEE